MLPALNAMLVTRVGPVEFVRLVKGASLIAIGRVERVFLINGHRFAEMVPEQTLKGLKRPRVTFLAESTWSCDTSGADVGERGLFLVFPIVQWAWGGHSPSRNAAIKEVRTKGPVYSLGSGEGRIVFGDKGMTPGKLGNTWYLHRLIMPHAVPPKIDAWGRPRYDEPRLIAAVSYSLSLGARRSQARLGKAVASHRTLK